MKWFCSPVPVFPGEKDSSKQYCLFCLWGEEGSACPDKLTWFWFLLHFAIQSGIFGHSQVRDWAYKLSQAVEPQQQLCCSGLGAADSQVPSESPHLSTDEPGEKSDKCINQQSFFEQKYNVDELHHSCQYRLSFMLQVLRSYLSGHPDHELYNYSCPWD